MDINSKKIFKTLNPNKVWIPIAIGLGIVFYLFYSDPDVSSGNLKLIFKAKPTSLVVAFLVLIARDIGYIYRIRTLTNKDLDWTSSLYVIILWEFASAVTPSVVGGTAVAVFILMKEGIKFGRSLAYVLLTAILDNMFFVLIAPLFMFFSIGVIFPETRAFELQLGGSLKFLFWISYTLIVLYTSVMAFALILKPRAFKWILLKITSIKWLRKWRQEANVQGDEMIIASKELKGKPFKYWSKIILATIFIWTARYVMLNSLVTAFADLDFNNHLLIFSRQVVMWVVMLISPTPGSSGTAEFFFNQFFTQFLGQYTIGTNILWRSLTYYPYLILGALFLPRWIRRVFFIKKDA